MTVAHDTVPKPAPSVLQQIVRAAAGTFAVLLAGALVWAAVANADRGRELWYRAAGDPGIRLADGVSLPTSARTVAAPVVRVTTWPASEDIARITAGTGAPVHPIAAGVARRLLGETGPLYVEPGQRRVYATPLGIVTVVEFAADARVLGRVLLFPTSTTMAAADAIGRTELLRRLATAWGAGARSAVPGVVVTIDPPMSTNVVGAHVMLGDVATEVGSAGWVDVGADGHFVMATVPIARVVSTSSVPVGSPAAAFDAIRHHSEGTQSDPMTVASAHLVEQNFYDGASDPVLFWTFTDADGRDVDLAPPG